MSELRRYCPMPFEQRRKLLGRASGGGDTPAMVEHAAGEYIEYSYHEAEIARLKEENEILRGRMGAMFIYMDKSAMSKWYPEWNTWFDKDGNALKEVNDELYD